MFKPEEIFDNVGRLVWIMSKTGAFVKALLNSIAEKHFKLDGPRMMDTSALDAFLRNMEDNKL